MINPALYWGDDPRVPGKEYRILRYSGRRDFRPVHQGTGGLRLPQALASFARGGRRAALAALTAWRALVTRGGVAGGRDRPRASASAAGGDVSGPDSQRPRPRASSSPQAATRRSGKSQGELAAEGGVNYNSEDWSRELRAWPGAWTSRPTTSAARTSTPSSRSRKPGGRIVVFGATVAGPTPKANGDPHSAQAPRRARDSDGHLRGVRRDARPYAEQGLRPKVNETFPLEETASGHPPPYGRRQWDGQDSPRNTRIDLTGQEPDHDKPEDRLGTQGDAGDATFVREKPSTLQRGRLPGDAYYSPLAIFLG